MGHALLLRAFLLILEIRKFFIKNITFLLSSWVEIFYLSIYFFFFFFFEIIEWLKFSFLFQLNLILYLYLKLLFFEITKLNICEINILIIWRITWIYKSIIIRKNVFSIIYFSNNLLRINISHIESIIFINHLQDQYFNNMTWIYINRESLIIFMLIRKNNIVLFFQQFIAYINISRARIYNFLDKNFWIGKSESKVKVRGKSKSKTKMSYEVVD